MNDSVYIFLWFVAFWTCFFSGLAMDAEEEGKKSKLMELSDSILCVEWIILMILGFTQVLPRM